MSRRIAIGLLAAAAALIASPAFADRECFENSCGMPNVVAAPPAGARPAETGAALVQVVHKAGPQKFAAAAPGAAHRAHARAGTQATRHARGKHRARHGSGFFLGDYLFPAGYGYLDLPVYPDAKVLPDDRDVPSDSSWRLCQISGEGFRYDPYDCEPYDYHPFGIYGHRPNGTYVGYRSAPIYVLAPNAKVIHLDRAD